MHFKAKLTDKGPSTDSKDDGKANEMDWATVDKFLGSNDICNLEIEAADLFQSLRICGQTKLTIKNPKERIPSNMQGVAKSGTRDMKKGSRGVASHSSLQELEGGMEAARLQRRGNQKSQRMKKAMR